MKRFVFVFATCGAALASWPAVVGADPPPVGYLYSPHGSTPVYRALPYATPIEDFPCPLPPDHHCEQCLPHEDGWVWRTEPVPPHWRGPAPRPWRPRTVVPAPPTFEGQPGPAWRRLQPRAAPPPRTPEPSRRQAPPNDRPQPEPEPRKITAPEPAPDRAASSRSNEPRETKTGGQKRAPASSDAGTSSPAPPFATPVPGKPGFVYSPFVTGEQKLVDVRGLEPGTSAKDPYTERVFRVP